MIALTQRAGTTALCLTLLLLLTGPARSLHAQDFSDSDPGAQKEGAGTDPQKGGATRPAAKANGNPAAAAKPKPGKPAPPTTVKDSAAERLQLEVELEKRREAAMQIRKPLLEPNAIAKYNRVKFLSVMRSGPQNNADKKIFDASLRYRVLELAELGNFKNAGDLRTKLLRDLKTCGSQIPGAVAKKKFCQETMGKVVTHAEMMLDNQFTVRLNAAYLIGKLNLEPAGVKKPPLPYLDAYQTLLKVATDPKQLPSVKLAAVSGLERILKYGNVANAIQDTIGDELIKVALKGNVAYPWLDEAVCQAMAEVKTSKDSRLKGLISIMSDKKREFRVRSAAAFAVGRTGWPPKDADTLAYRVIDLMHQMSQAYNKNPRNTMLISYSFRCYLAYNHATGEDKNAKIGFLKRAPTVQVQQSFNGLVAPTINQMFNRAGSRISSKLIDAQAKWLKDNAGLAPRA